LQVFFLATKEKYNDMPVRKFIPNKKMKVNYENGSIAERVDRLLEHRCKICTDKDPEKSFRALKEHMRRAHTLFFCDLCLDLKVKRKNICFCYLLS